MLSSLNNAKVPSLAGTSNDTGTVVRKKKNQTTAGEGAREVDDKNVIDDEVDDDDDVEAKSSSSYESCTASATAQTSLPPTTFGGGKSDHHHHHQTKINLDRGELLKLLSVFEGELQARDEVIAILKSERSNNCEGRYGLGSQPMKALQRDAASFDDEDADDEDIAAHTKDQLKKIIQQQKDSHKRLKQMFLASQDKNQRLVTELNSEKRKQHDYMLKSDDFVNLLEEDRDRLKHLLQQEKIVHERKERELTWKIKESAEELGKMKTLSIELIEERQKQLQSFAEQRQLTATLQSAVDELKVKVKQTELECMSEREHANQLENDLEEQSKKHIQELEELGDQLTAERDTSTQHKEQISTMKRRIKHLQMMDKSLRKTDDQLLKIKEHLTEQSAEKLLDEIESLRETMCEMEEADKIYAQAQEECRELREALESEITLTRNLKAEVEKLKKHHKSQVEMERCVEESVFRFDEIEHQFEIERRKSDKLKAKFHEFQDQLRCFVETERMLEESQNKLEACCHTIELMKNERGELETKLEQAEERCVRYQEQLEEEKLKVTEAKQKQIVESRESLRMKEEMTVMRNRHAEEHESMQQHIDSLNSTIVAHHSKGDEDEDKLHLRRQISALQGRLEQAEAKNRHLQTEKSEMEDNAQVAKNRLVQSAGKLKELVTSGLNEQLALVKCDEYAHRIKELEAENQRLRSTTAANNNLPTATTTTNNGVSSSGSGGGVFRMKLIPRNNSSSASLNNHDKRRMTTESDSEENSNKTDPTPLRPPSRTSIRHAALRKTSPSPTKKQPSNSSAEASETSSNSSASGKPTVARTSSLKSIRNRTFSAGTKSSRAREESTLMSGVVEGRPPSRAAAAGGGRGDRVVMSSPKPEVKSNQQQGRSRSIVRSRMEETKDGVEAGKPPTTKSGRSKSKTRNKSLTRVANLIKSTTSSNSSEEKTNSKTNHRSTNHNNSSGRTTPALTNSSSGRTTPALTGIPKLRSTTPTLASSSSSKKPPVMMRQKSSTSSASNKK